MGEVIRKRIRVLSGSNEKVLQHLEAVGLSKDLVPIPIGGDAPVDMKQWIQERRDAGL